MKTKLALGVMAWVMASGCMHVTYRTGKPYSQRVEDGSNHFFLWGLANGGEIDTDEECGPGGAAEVVVYQSFVDGLLGFFTLGIYTPRSYEVTCATEGAAP